MNKSRIGMKSLIGLSVLTVGLCVGCTQPETAQRVLTGSGYKDISMQGYDWFNCSKDDFYHDKFTATGSTGQKVSGVVCGGLLFKGATIRLD